MLPRRPLRARDGDDLAGILLLTFDTGHEPMMDWLADQSPVWQSLGAGVFTWSVTALGAAIVVFSRTVSQRLLDTMLGFAAGVMVAASFWSLLAPAIEISEGRDSGLASGHGRLCLGRHISACSGCPVAASSSRAARSPRRGHYDVMAPLDAARTGDYVAQHSGGSRGGCGVWGSRCRSCWGWRDAFRRGRSGARNRHPEFSRGYRGGDALEGV